MKAHTYEQWIGGVCATLAILNSGSHIIDHIRRNQTKLWLCTVRILGVVPLYAAISFACLMLETSDMHWAEILNFIREVYEAVAILSFIQFVLNYLGGPIILAEILQEKGGEYVHKCPCLGSWQKGPQFVYKSIGNIIQYLYVMMFVFFANVLIWTQEREILSWGVQYVRYVRPLPNIFKSLSAMWALYNLGVFYHELHEELQGMNAVWKFLSIKGIVFFTFWQGVVIAIFVALDFVPDQREDPVEHLWSQTQIADGIRNLLLCVEMMVFSQMHRQAYQVDEMNEWLEATPLLMNEMLDPSEPPSPAGSEEALTPRRRKNSLKSMIDERLALKVIQFADLGELNAQLKRLRIVDGIVGGQSSVKKVAIEMNSSAEMSPRSGSDGEQAPLHP